MSEKTLPMADPNVELVFCGCGHAAINHHGIDPDPRNGGCFGAESGHPWSAQPKCPCTLTCTGVMDVNARIPVVSLPYRDELELTRASHPTNSTQEEK